MVAITKQCRCNGIAESSPWTEVPEIDQVNEARRRGISNGMPCVVVVEEEETEAKHMVMSTKSALALFVLFVAFVITIIVVRAELNFVPRSFDFFTNMVIAGVIIFGGGQYAMLCL